MYCTELENCTERKCKNSVCPRMHHITGNSCRYGVLLYQVPSSMYKIKRWVFLILRILYTVYCIPVLMEYWYLYSTTRSTYHTNCTPRCLLLTGQEPGTTLCTWYCTIHEQVRIRYLYSSSTTTSTPVSSPQTTCYGSD